MNDHEADLSMKARALVEAGRALDEPSSADRNRVRARVAATLGAASALTAAERAEASAADGGRAMSAISRAGFSAKGAGLLMIAMILATTGIVSLRAARTARAGVVASRTTVPRVLARDQKPSQERVRLAASETPVMTDEPSTIDTARKRGDVGELDRAPRAVTAPVLTRRSTIVTSRSKRPAAQSPSPSAAPDVAPPPSAATPSEPSAPAQTAKAILAPPPPSATHDGPPQTTTTPVHERAPSLAGELALLGAAQQAMASGDLTRALNLLDQHAARYRTDSLVPERLAARAATLCRMKKTAEGLRELHRLQMHSPTSPLLAWARESCPAGPSGP